MFWMTLGILVALWLLGYTVFHIGIGPLVHLMLIVVLIMCVVNLLTPRRTV